MDILQKQKTKFKKEDIDRIVNKFNLSSIVVELLFSRGYTTEEQIEKFLNPKLSDLYNPFLLKDMDRAVERIKKAIKNNEKVLIFGDYDVDGVSASAILIKYFASINFYVDFYLPNRYIDGYGLTNDTIDKVKKEYNPSLIITVDCGIACASEVEYAKTLGIEIIVTDHHDIPEVLPNTIVVNAKLPNQKYPFSQLCGTGVALKLVQALAGIHTAEKYMAICALATIADIVPLTDENRAIVKLGLKNFEKDLPLGIKMLIKDSKLSYNISAGDVSFRLSPKINAAGRMGDATVALKLFIEEDKILLKNTIDTLNNLNINRQSLCNDVYDDAIEKLKKINLSNYKSIVLYSKNWDSGILGIVSAKIAGEFNKPTILFSEVGDELKGSARSINDINIFETISSMKEVVEAFGGHKMAAGLTIKTKNFKNFIVNLNNILSQNYTPKDFLPHNSFDYDIRVDQITEKFAKDLEVLEPCGCQNPKPLFRLTIENSATFASLPRFPNHININLKNFSAVAFNSHKYLPLLKNTDKQEVLVELQLNEYKNKKYVKGIAKNIVTGKIKKPSNNDFINGEYLKQIYFKEGGRRKITFFKKEELQNLIIDSCKDYFGTLFIASTYDSYINFVNQYGDKDYFFYHNMFEIVQNSGVNSILLAPNNFKNFNAYKKIIFIDQVLNKGYIDNLLANTIAEVYLPDYKKANREVFVGLTSDRNVFGEYFKIISKFSSLMLSFENELAMFKQIKLANPQMKKLSYKQFIFCLYTFIQLGIFEFQQYEGYLCIKENKKVFSNLNNSKFYNEVSLILKTI